MIFLSGVLYGLIGTWLFARLTDASSIRASVNRMIAHVLGFRLFLDEPVLVLREQWSLLAENARLLRLVALPCVILAVLFVLLYGPMDRAFGRRQLNPGESAVVTAPWHGAGLQLTVPPGITVETPPVRTARTGQVNWRVRAVRAYRGEFVVTAGREIADGARIDYPRVEWVMWFAFGSVSGVLSLGIAGIGRYLHESAHPCRHSNIKLDGANSECLPDCLQMPVEETRQSAERMLTELQYRLLKRIAPAEGQAEQASVYEGKSKLEMALGATLRKLVPGQTVIDFGCGEGQVALDLARCGAAKVIGLDIRESVLRIATHNAEVAGLGDRCEFRTSTDTPAGLIVSTDAFEHFEDPGGILRLMHSLLAPRGVAIVSFGPTWYHPLGGHLFSVFPWAHLLFSESALIRWRADLRSDGATRFGEVEGGLNQMTISRFERLVPPSGFRIEWLESVPIRKLRFMHCRLTREFTTAMVRAKLVKNG